MGRIRGNIGLTVCTVIKCILNRPVVPPDEEILAEVRMAIPHSIINQDHLARYKHLFRRGALPGMDGYCHPINQPEEHIYVPKKYRRNVYRVRCVNGCPLCGELSEGAKYPIDKTANATGFIGEDPPSGEPYGRDTA